MSYDTIPGPSLIERLRRQPINLNWEAADEIERLTRACSAADSQLLAHEGEYRRLTSLLSEGSRTIDNAKAMLSNFGAPDEGSLEQRLAVFNATKNIEVNNRVAYARTLVEALKHQRTALMLVRDRQGGRASEHDLNQGIAQIDAALAENSGPASDRSHSYERMEGMPGVYWCRICGQSSGHMLHTSTEIGLESYKEKT